MVEPSSPGQDPVQPVAPPGAGSAPVPAGLPLRPRLWTAVVGFASTWLAAQIVAGLALIPLLAWRAARSSDIHAEATRAMQSPIGLAVVVLATQVVFGAMPLVLARFSPQGPVGRLGLRTPRLPVWTWTLASIGTFAIPYAFSIVVAAGAIDLHDLGSALDPVARATGWSAFMLVLLMSFLPGICEELLFRGLLQRRLVERLGPPLGIALTATAFALSHFDNLPHVAVTFLYGLWFGFLAWSSDSIWPGAVCHTVNNLVLIPVSLVWQEPAARAAPTPSEWMWMIAITTVTGACAALVVRWLVRTNSGRTQPSNAHDKDVPVP